MMKKIPLSRGIGSREEMTEGLPTRLGAEPLVDVVFELRFSSSASAPDILPGFMYSAFGKHAKAQRLDVSDIPRPIRDQDQNLRFAPLTRVLTEEGSISIGDRVLVIGCKLPYPGWERFKGIIFKVLSVVKESGLIDSVSRYSLKYVDLLQVNSVEEQVRMINADIKIAGYKLKNQSFNLRIELNDDQAFHLLTVVSSANMKKEDGALLSGIVIDVDSIVRVENKAYDDWHENDIDSGLESLHKKNKALFFNCLSNEALEKLEPEYD